jgi:hypothetical protein
MIIHHSHGLQSQQIVGDNEAEAALQQVVVHGL